MRFGRILAPFILAAVLCCAAAVVQAEVLSPVYDGSRTPEYLFVLSADSVSYEDDVLTLHGVPGVVYFSDRPYRLYGHMNVEDFGDYIEENMDDNSPNASLSLLESEDIVVVELLGAPTVLDTDVSWSVKVLSGDLPGEGGAVSLFVDSDTVNPMITD